MDTVPLSPVLPGGSCWGWVGRIPQPHWLSWAEWAGLLSPVPNGVGGLADLDKGQRLPQMTERGTAIWEGCCLAMHCDVTAGVKQLLWPHLLC